MHALLIDDSPASRLPLLQALNDYGLRVVECHEPSRVMDLLHRRPEIRLVLVQWNVAGGAADLVKQLRGSPVTCLRRIIMVIGEDNREAITSGLEAGIDDYLLLPFSAAHLREKLDLLGILAA